MKPYAEFVAELNPIFNASNIINGIATGNNAWGNKMTKTDYAFSALGLFGFGEIKVGSLLKKPLSNYELVVKAGEKAFNYIPGKGPVLGTLRHEYATALLTRYQRMFGYRGLEFKVMSSDNRAIIDVLDVANKIIYDWKFGKAVLSNKQLSKYQKYWIDHLIFPIHIK